MIYAFSLIMCLGLIWYYDILECKKGKNSWYAVLMLWFIAVSAFQYRLGSDLPDYMYKYESFNPHNISGSLFFEGEDRRQPGWLFLVYLCRLITSDYFLMKFLQAAFLNYAVFAFFRRESEYEFTCILLYAVFSYFVLNFNVLRQSYSIGFGLFAFSFAKNKCWWKYFLCTFLAFMFHNSALLLLSFPILFMLSLFFRDVKALYLGAASLFFLFVLLSKINLESLFVNLFSSSVMSENMEDQALGYMGQEELGVQDEFSVFSLKRLLVAFFTGYYIYKERDLYVGSMGVFYLLVLILSAFMPIFWRFRLYFEFAYFLIVTQTAYMISISFFQRKNKVCRITSLLIVALAMYHPIQDYMTTLPGSTYRYIHQYYPYQNILTKEVDKKKEFFFSPY